MKYPLSLLPDDIHVTVEMAISYYEVSIEAVITRHRLELEYDGLVILTGFGLREFISKLQIATSFHPRLNRLTIIPRRAVLRIGMLLRDSEVAKTVRSYLLNLEGLGRPYLL